MGDIHSIATRFKAVVVSEDLVSTNDDLFHPAVIVTSSRKAVAGVLIKDLEGEGAEILVEGSFLDALQRKLDLVKQITQEIDDEIDRSGLALTDKDLEFDWDLV